jgi:hypothetical protein
MLTYKYVDDGWFCVGWWVFDGETRYADAHSEAQAKEICDAVNIIRRLGERIKEVADNA